MDEKTEELREIFVDVTEEETVTESQTEQRGSLLREGSVDERLAAAVGKMRDRFDFETEFDDRALCTVVRRFYDGDDDEAIAATLDVSTASVFEARTDLHLIRDSDSDSLDLSAVRKRLADGDAVDAIAAELEADPEAVDRARRVVETESRAQRVSQRFRTEFEEILTDADIAVRLTADSQEDGLEEATEGMEVDVDF